MTASQQGAAEAERKRAEEASFEHHILLAEQIAQLSLHRSRDDKRLTAMETELKANTAATARIDKATAGIVSMFDTLESGLKVMGWIGNAGAWILKAGSALGIGYAAFLAFKAWLSGGGGRP